MNNFEFEFYPISHWISAKIAVNKKYLSIKNEIISTKNLADLTHGT